MSKRKLLIILLETFFVLVFNFIFFFNLGYEHTAGIWISYGLLHFAYIMFILTPVFESKEYLYKITSYIISFSYFVIELVLICLLIMLEKVINIKFVISLQVFITTIYLIVLIINLITNDSIKNKHSEYDIQNNFIKNISAKMKYIESITNSEKQKRKVNELYCTIHSSPSKSNVDVNIYEEKIIENIDKLEIIIETNDEEKINEKMLEIERLLNKRNFMLKSKK